MFKKSLLFFCLCLCCISTSWAVCDVKELSSGSLSNLSKYIAPNADEPTKVYVCGDNCENGNVIVLKNGSQGSEKHSDNDIYYRCNTKNNNGTWEEIKPGAGMMECYDGEEHVSQSLGWYDEDTVLFRTKKLSETSVSYACGDVCYKDGEKHYNFQCTKERDGKKYVFSSIPTYYEWCNGKGYWSWGHMQRCFTFDDWASVSMVPDGMNRLADDGGESLFINPTTVRPVQDGVYEYSDNVNDMCITCASNSFIFFDGKRFYCTYSEQHAWCNYAKYKNNANVEWKDNECVCVDVDGNPDTSKAWNGAEHICKEEKTKCGVTCDSDGLDIICEENGFAHNFVCNGTTWVEQNPASLIRYWCTAEIGTVTKIEQKQNMTEIKWKNDSQQRSIYINTDQATKNANAYDTNLDFGHQIMCFDCPSGWFSHSTDKSRNDGARKICYQNEQEAWCEFKRYWDEEAVEWKDNACKCIDYDAGKEWNTTTHTCENANASDTPEEQTDNAEATCEQQYKGNDEAIACCNLKKSGITTDFVVDENGTLTCNCVDINKEWKDNKCVEKAPNVPAVTKEDFEAAKSTVDKFFENAESKASGWKDATGKVNTKRIASDVTAGVVLGTVGGVVSGVVIKKKQIEKGFEVLHCAIGGQTVANWGDTFSIGLTR